MERPSSLKTASSRPTPGMGRPSAERRPAGVGFPAQGGEHEEFVKIRGLPGAPREQIPEIPVAVEKKRLKIAVLHKEFMIRCYAHARMPRTIRAGRKPGAMTSRVFIRVEFMNVDVAVCNVSDRRTGIEQNPSSFRLFGKADRKVRAVLD